jgi:hypothetical protein
LSLVFAIVVSPVLLGILCLVCCAKRANMEFAPTDSKFWV